jgi:LysM repeat protein
MKLTTLVATGLLTSAILASPESRVRYTKTDYISLWKEVAIQNSHDFKIPASITLAQGILESGFGNSDLAQKANNHFGIKCHNWSGDTFYADDDKKDECFRMYNDASQSFADHSHFLTSRERYNFLFEYDKTDYKSWAKGLKKAGYATNSKYPTLLIKIIEENNLDQYDKDLIVNPEVVSKPMEVSISDNSYKSHDVFLHKNAIRYVKARKGDTFYKIAKEKGMALWQLYKYNDFHSKQEVLNEGDIVFLQPKRLRTKLKQKVLVLSKPMSLIGVSQIEGIKLKKLKKLNPSIADVKKEMTPGVKVFLK